MNIQHPSFAKDFFKKYFNALKVVILLVVALSAGYFFGSYIQKNKYKDFVKSFRTLRENSDKFAFINPLIGGVSLPATEVGLFTKTKDEIEDYLQAEEKKGNLYDYSFYYRDLNTGLWFGANDSAEFLPASLFKLPIAIAAYKQAEDDPYFLDKRLQYTQEIADRNILIQLNAQSTLSVGSFYSVKELINIMLTASDNGAKDLLLNVMDMRYIEQLFSIVTSLSPTDAMAYQISSRKYAHFLRMLYGSSYLNEEHSEFILSLLAKSTFKDGLAAGVPGNILIAHKFGAYQVEEKINGREIMTQQLHDCGVVYHQDRPYVFCLMTKGKNLEILYKVISKVSKIVYDEQEKDL